MSHRAGDLPRMTSASWPFFPLCLCSRTLLEIFRLPSTSLMIEHIPQDLKCTEACTPSLAHQAPATLWTAINVPRGRRVLDSGRQVHRHTANRHGHSLLEPKLPLHVGGPVQLSNTTWVCRTSDILLHAHFSRKFLLWSTFTSRPFKEPPLAPPTWT